MTLANQDTPNHDSLPEMFGIYYMNYSKVVELNMIRDNRIRRGFISEQGEYSAETGAIGLSGKAAGGIPGVYSAQVLSNIQSSLQNGASSNVRETYEVKQTKSTELSKLLPYVRVLDKSFSEEDVGKLIRVDEANLSLLEDDQLATVTALKHEALEGFRVQGLDVNNLVKSFLQDYAYVLVGNTDGLSFALKIPTESSNEFENKYGIRDLLLGTVSIVGVYKGELLADDLRKSTFTELQSMGVARLEYEESCNSQKIIKSSNASANDGTGVQKTPKDIPEKIAYIDVIAIIQPIELFQSNINDEADTFMNPERVEAKSNLRKRVGMWLCRGCNA